MLLELQKSSPKILVIGDLIVDKYLWGDTSRISPEAPVQIIDINNESKVLGGAGNVANNLKSLGAEVDILSVIGNCEISNELINLLELSEIDTKFLVTQVDRVTSKKTRIISSKQQVIRYDIESNNDISSESEDKIFDIFRAIFKNFDLILLSDYGKGVLTRNITRNIISLANKENIKVIADPKGKDFSKYNGAYLITPNKKEAIEATNIQIYDTPSLNLALNKLKNECDLDIALITLSDEGIAILDKDLRVHPTVAREVFDVTGAGDTVIASLGFAIANHLDIDSAVKFANLTAGVVVGKVGSAVTTFEEILEYESSLHKSGSDEHIKTLEQIVDYLRKPFNSGKKIVFTNGCFDILHLGHVKYLEKAKELGDILIVGINTDLSVKKIKGDSRPINSLYDRAFILASLECVDFVTPFEDDTPLKLIENIKPDVLVKGADYANQTIVGSEIVKEVVLIDFVDGKSTSKMISKILGK